MKFKKMLALLLAIITALLCSCQAFAFEGNLNTNIPVVLISGDSVPIQDPDENIYFSTSTIAKKALSVIEGETSEETKENAINLVKEFLGLYYKGSFTHNFSPLYEKVYDTVYQIFEGSQLDCNGEINNDSDIAAFRYDMNKEAMTTERHSGFRTTQYQFYYDWRLDPFVSADKLNEFIKGVKEATGFEQVGIICRCLGANVFLAYVDEYGMDDICGVAFDGVVANGNELLGDPIAGNFVIELDPINRMLLDANREGLINVDPQINEIIDAVSESGVYDIIRFCVKTTAFWRIKKGVISSFARASVFTWPNYWAGVGADDYEDAKNLVFGKEGSELREQYAGLIEKIDNYDVRVRRRIPELLNIINENANFIIVSKYGDQLSAISTNNDLIGDHICSVKRSSFGATTSCNYNTLSDEYIANAVAEGKGKYISPDKQIDASTCLFPDQTFFVKGAAHSDWTMGEMVLMTKAVSADHQITVDEYPEYHFMIYDYDTDTNSQMTEENCHTEAWTIEKKSINPIAKIKGLVRAIKLIAELL